MPCLVSRGEVSTSLHASVARHRRVPAYLASARRIAFNEEGIFRRYPALDG